MATKGSGLKSTSINGVKIYMVSSQQRNPASWVGSKKQRPSRKDKSTLFFSFFALNCCYLLAFKYKFCIVYVKP